MIHQVLRRRGSGMLFKKFSSTNNKHSESGIHFENHRIEDVNQNELNNLRHF